MSDERQPWKAEMWHGDSFLHYRDPAANPGTLEDCSCLPSSTEDCPECGEDVHWEAGYGFYMEFCMHCGWER